MGALTSPACVRPGAVTRPRRSVLWMAAASLAWSCGGDDLPAPDVAAKIDDRAINYAAFESYLERNLGESDARLSSSVLSSLFDRFLDEELLWCLAEDDGVVGATADRDLNVRMLLLDRAIEIGDAEVMAYYQAHRADYDLPERVGLRQVLVKDRAAAERIRGALLEGGDFKQVVDEEGDGESTPFLGEQPELAREDLPLGFADSIFALKPGEVSEIISAEYGYHVFQVTERWPAETVDVGRVAGEIRDILHGERAEAQLERLLTEAREQYDVEVYGRNLPFNYEGRLREPEGAGAR